MNSLLLADLRETGNETRFIVPDLLRQERKPDTKDAAGIHDIHALFQAIKAMADGFDAASTGIRTLADIGLAKSESIMDR